MLFFLRPPSSCVGKALYLVGKHMTDIHKLEKKVIIGLNKLLTNEKSQLNRWRNAGRVITILGWVFLTLTFMAIFQATHIPAYFLFISLASGLCIGLGVWFSSFSYQWPILQRYIDAERVNQRAAELDVSQKKPDN